MYFVDFPEIIFVWYNLGIILNLKQIHKNEHFTEFIVHKNV